MSYAFNITMRLSGFIIFCFLSLKTGFAIDVYNVPLDNLLEMQQGLGWPHSLKVAVGHEALLKLRRHSPGAQCTVTTPTGVTFNVHSPPNSRYERWGDDCGLRVRNVGLADEGRWRFTYSAGQSSVTGWIEVYVEDDVTTYTASPIILQDGGTHTSIELTSLENSYCMVAQPFSQSTLIPGHCEVTLDHTTRAVQGNWNVLLGIPGKVEELHVQRHVTVQVERLDVGYVLDANTGKLNLFCNIPHTSKNITFCRFQKTTSSSGYNIKDGLSDGHRSYYGEGFDSRQCGMTIEQPTAQDYGTWRCSLGLQMWVGTQIVSQTPLQALISVASNSRTSRRNLRNGEIRMVFTQLDLEFSIQCHADVSLRYCWFEHPNGTQYTPQPLTDENQQYCRCTAIQKRKIVEYMASHPLFANGEFSGPLGSQRHESEWQNLATMLREFGPDKSVAAWKVTWRDLKRKARGDNAAFRRAVVATGNNSEIPPVGESELMVLSVIGTDSSIGVGPPESTVGDNITEELSKLNQLKLEHNDILREQNRILARNQYSGVSLQAGDCGITFASATEDEAGRWTCHMGPNDQVGIEFTDTLNVRVTGPLAANEEEVETSIGAAATLYCHTANGMRPLDYCRFITPSLLGLSIDATVTEENAILNRYYFTPGRNLDYGDCSLTVSAVQEENLGVWTCAALIDNDAVESRATIILYTPGSTSHSARRVSQAGIAGMVIGLVALLTALAGVVWFRRHKLFPRKTLGRDSTIAFKPRTDRSMSTTASVSSNNSSDFEIQIRDQNPTTSR